MEWEMVLVCRNNGFIYLCIINENSERKFRTEYKVKVTEWKVMRQTHPKVTANSHTLI